MDKRRLVREAFPREAAQVLIREGGEKASVRHGVGGMQQGRAAQERETVWACPEDNSEEGRREGNVALSKG